MRLYLEHIVFVWAETIPNRTSMNVNHPGTAACSQILACKSRGSDPTGIPG